MAASDDILSSLPIDQLASRLGASPQEVQAAASSAVPALLGGLEANASSGGQGSLLDALGQHDPSLVEGGVDLDQVDPDDGQKIASHVFGSNEDQVYSALGSTSGGAGGDLVKKLMPLLAPIVMSYLSKQILGKAGAGGAKGTTAAGSGGLGDILQNVLGGAMGGASSGGGKSSGGGLGDILGGLLGGGRK